MRRRLAVVSLVGVLGLGACAGTVDVDADRLDRPVEFAGIAQDAAVPDEWVDASVRLAAALVALAEDGQNAVVSPLSLQLALAMLREGAAGRVAAEIDTAVGLSGADSQAVADLRAFLAAYEGDVAGIDPDDPPATPLLHIADGVFVQPGAPVTDRFLERVAAYHLAQVYEVDFAGGNAKPVLDAWVNRETGGLLTEAPIDPAPDTLVSLLDAVTFGASWQTPFDPQVTRDGPFRLADGQTAQVPTMHALVPARYAEGEGWRAIELPYTEGFSMRLVLPDAVGPLADEQWRAAHAALDAADPSMVSIWLPSWQTDTTLDLTDALPALGLGSLASPGGDLDGVFPGAFVSAVALAATITVAERGTVAAAVTQLEMATSAPSVEHELRLDHPFEYQVVDQAYGLVLFAGRVLDPS